MVGIVWGFVVSGFLGLFSFFNVVVDNIVVEISRRYVLRMFSYLLKESTLYCSVLEIKT